MLNPASGTRFVSYSRVWWSRNAILVNISSQNLLPVKVCHMSQNAGVAVLQQLSCIIIGSCHIYVIYVVYDFNMTFVGVFQDSRVKQLKQSEVKMQHVFTSVYNSIP